MPQSAPGTTLLLLAVISFACAPKAPEDTTSDTDVTDTSGSTSAATEPTTGDATDTTDTTTGGDACTEPDPVAKASVSFDFGAWPVAGGEPNTVEIAADCAVESATTVDGATSINLICTEGQVVDQPIHLGITAPDDFTVDLTGVTDVRLDAYWQSDGHHIGTGHWFVLHDAADGALLLAGLDHDSAASPNPALAPLTVTRLEDVCPATCGDCLDADGTERISLSFAHDDGSLALVDQQRGQLVADGRSYDIILSEAVFHYCLNCWGTYVWVLSGAAQP